MVDEIEAARERCKRVINAIPKLPARTNITDSCKRTLLKLAHSELNFLSQSNHPHLPLSVNVGHLEAVVHLLQQPFITGVSRVCKPIPSSKIIAHVDIVCMLNKKPVWILVSDRNPQYVSWLGSHKGKTKGFKFRIQQVLAAAAQSSHVMKPSSVILFFSRGLQDFVFEKLQAEFGASELDFCEELEGGWVNVVLPTSYQDARLLQINLDLHSDSCTNSCVSVSVNVSDSECGVNKQRSLLDTDTGTGGPKQLQDEHTKAVNLDDDDAFSSLIISGIKVSSIKVKPEDLTEDDDLINFDTTALIALVSGISNGCAHNLLAAPEIELRQRFKGNFDFVIAQVTSEIQNPILAELAGVTSGKRAIICESVLSEFNELVSLCGGPNEKLRADKILKCLMVVPDNPSARMVGLPTTRKLALKNKVVFGTGDHWRAPTLTANMAFVRAVSQTGLSLFTIAHRPRALTGD